MALNMDLIVFAQTGHVLAGAPRQQTGGGGPKVEEFVGDGLWLRNPLDGALQLVVAAQHLGVATAPLRDDVLTTPRSFQLVDGLPEQKAELNAAPVTLTGTNLTVTLPAATAEDVEVWVVIDVSTGPIVQSVEILEGDSDATVPLALPNGSYQVTGPGARIPDASGSGNRALRRVADDRHRHSALPTPRRAKRWMELGP